MLGPRTHLVGSRVGHRDQRGPVAPGRVHGRGQRPVCRPSRHRGRPRLLHRALGDKPGCDGNLSLVATQYADGTASGQYTDRFSHGGGIKAVVDCVRVVGNQAWVSGWITSGRAGDNDLAGLPFTTRVQDNSTSGAQPPDQVSTSHVGDETPCSEMVPWDLFDMPQGQVVVN